VKQSSALHDVEKKINFLGYKFFHNSLTSSRGTAILISRRLNCDIIDSFCDNDGNILMFKARIGNVTVTLGSIYGPNTDDMNFFDTIDDRVKFFNSDYTILGGDWNTTLDPRNNDSNIDTLNTAGIPSSRRSNRLITLCNDNNLGDPFRHFYPDKREFTYVPFPAAAINRSRLDFFLISKQLLDVCINCRVPNSLSSINFDHKPVYLLFRRENPYKKRCINDMILKDADIQDVVGISVIETYINHIVPDNQISDIDIGRYKTLIGNVLVNQNLLNACKLSLAESGYNRVTVDRCETLRCNINRLLTELPTLESLENRNISCERDTFLEVLIIGVKNSALAHQHNFFKVKNAKKKCLDKRICNLKLDFNANSGEILRLERELDNLIEMDLREEILKMKHFESLNNEKITPYFLGLAKRPQNSESLSDINRDDGTPFDNRNVRSDYIKSYYENIYKRVPVDITDQSINNFLGDTVNHPEVLGSKLSENEREELEQDLTILEFDKAVESAKNNTAPGIDSISNKFIKTFWPFFRKPLFDYTKHCYNKGTLTDNFRSAKIRLIPKKGDLTKLSNWRPISLLNCFYKIISRVIATRLRKVMDKITKVAQKGFSGNKYCQEVLIGIVDSINTVKHTRRNGALISLDIKKAFDSTSHSYLQQVYKFFNFGPNFIRWLNLVCTNRRACIILENEYYSEFFDLERGNAQGDTISPYIFNLGFQILLFKLNFDLQIL
jgi:exonuclease III